MTDKNEYRYKVRSYAHPQYITRTNDFKEALRSQISLNSKYGSNTFHIEDTFRDIIYFEEGTIDPAKAEEEDVTLEVKGKKYDSNKPMTGTILRVFPYALNAVGACIKLGATKYPDPNNWKKNKNALVRYNDSLVRHLTKHFTGNELDEETKLPHLAHVAWNALAILELYLMENPEKAKELMYPQEIRE